MINTHIVTLEVNGMEDFDESNPVRLIFTPARVSLEGDMRKWTEDALCASRLYGITNFISNPGWNILFNFLCVLGLQH